MVNPSQNFSVCHWNLKSTVTGNFSKISFLKAYNAMHTHDIICLLETYLNHDILFDNGSLKIWGYKLIRIKFTLGF